jgi:hypothetical protein
MDDAQRRVLEGVTGEVTVHFGDDLGENVILADPGADLPFGVVVGKFGEALVVDLETPTTAAERMTAEAAGE